MVGEPSLKLAFVPFIVDFQQDALAKVKPFLDDVRKDSKDSDIAAQQP